MRLALNPGTDGIGRIAPADDGAVPPGWVECADPETLAAFLAGRDLSGAILRLDRRARRPDDVAGLAMVISAATIPVVASIAGEAEGPIRDLADACHFRVVEEEGEARARALLGPMVAGRPALLVRSVVESVGNAFRMEKAGALERETDLFLAVAGARRRIVRSMIASAQVVSREDLTEALARAPLSAEEAETLAGRHPQSLAGTIAAKEAIARLLSTVAGSRVDPADIGIGHDAEGAPVIRRLPAGLVPGARVFVSITHTAETAWALAAIETEAGG